MTAGAVIVIASCQSRGTPPPEPTPAEGGFAGVAGSPSGTPTTPPAATVTATANAPPAATACPTGMREVTGAYCADVEHLCLAGYPGIGSPWQTYPNGAKGITYCEHYKVGHAVCLGAQKPMRFCVDTYEYPNRDGAMPQVLVSWLDAAKLCDQQGKRLCDEDEWTLACEGTDRLPYPYGWDRDATACNLEKKYKKDLEASGSRPRCTSPFGVYDMTGNVDEWTRNVLDVNPGIDHPPYVSIFKGGHMLGKVRNRCRPSTRQHGPGYSDKTAGFRCCADGK